jgi:hypothetical protein
LQCIRAIAQLGDVVVVNIEPSLHLPTLLRHPVPEVIDFAYRRRRGYSDAMSRALLYLQIRGEVEVLYQGNSGYSPRAINVPTIAIWKPRN